MKSYNGWSASPDKNDIGVVPLTVAGVAFPPGVRGGPVHDVFTYVLEQFHRRVEPLVKGWCWGFAYRQNRNADNLSCHASGTAVDVNAPRHPNGKAGTFTPAQVREIRKILAEVDNVVRWGGTFGKPDEMHFEIHATPAEVARVSRRLRTPKPVPQEEFVMASKAELEELLDDAVASITGGVRSKDKKDTDPQHVSNADVLTAIDRLASSIDARLRALEGKR